MISTTPRPRIVCLCGSTRFSEAFRSANLKETLAGRIVLSIGCDTRSDEDLALAGQPIDKAALDELHLRKVELADEILVLNKDGYIGESTSREICHARRLHKCIRWQFGEPGSWAYEAFGVAPASLFPCVCEHAGCSLAASWWRFDGLDGIDGDWFACDRHAYVSSPALKTTAQP